MDPLLHALFWSLALNAGVFCLVSALSFPPPVERVQAAQFVDVFDLSRRTRGWARGGAEAEELLVMAQRILGPGSAQEFFRAEADRQGKEGFLPDTTPEFIDRLERRLAGSVGAATAHAMIGQIIGGAAVSVEDLMAVANETAQIMEYSSQLQEKSEELSRTARALAEANEKLTQISIQKDAFLSQISHELRTPMTSIRAFSEILMEPDGLPDELRTRYARIIHDEAIRLTRLLDDLLDLSVLEHGAVQLQESAATLRELIDRAILASNSIAPEREFAIERDPPAEAVTVMTDTGRLTQVLINLVSNARKYCDAAHPRLRIAVRAQGEAVEVDVVDNGSGIPRESQALIFEKFARLTDTTRAGGAGLGLAICREIMGKLGGTIIYVPGQGGAAFRLRFPRQLPRQVAGVA
jgi:signal transduction histidine kinase